MTTLADALLADIVAHPGDPTPRRVLRDHLLEADAWTEAAALAAVLAHPEADGCRLLYADWCEDANNWGRRDFVRVQVELAGGGGCSSDWCEGGELDDEGQVQEHTCGWSQRLQRRELDLFTTYGAMWFGPNACLPPPSEREQQAGLPFHVVRRGFVEEVACQYADWLTHGKALAARHPVTTVRLVDRYPAGPLEYRRKAGLIVEVWSWDCQETMRRPEDLPHALFRFLAGGEPYARSLISGEAMTFLYYSQESATDDLAQAALRFARA